MAEAVAVVSVIVSAAGLFLSYTQAEAQTEYYADQAEAQEEYYDEVANQAIEEANQAAEEAVLEEQQAAQKVAYETEVAYETAYSEIGTATENAEITKEEVTDEYKKVQAAQIAGAAAAGLDPTIGSTAEVMRKSNEEYLSDIDIISKGLADFVYARKDEADLVAEGGEFDLSQFLASSTMYTGFEVANREAEAALYRQQASAISTQSSFATYGLLLGLASTAVSGYSLYNMDTSQTWGVLAQG